VHLEKRLPVAAGIGGGSADAAALLRAVAGANPEAGKGVDWLALATRLGADVAVCLASRAAWMSGAGEIVVPIEGGVPPLAAVLVNPCAPVPAGKTALVFRSLGAPSIEEGCPRLSSGPAIGSRSELMALLAAHGNDLEMPARVVMPEIPRVMAALRGLAGVEAVRLSGAGPTAFGIFADMAAAVAAANQLRRSQPGWWVDPTMLR
jgi:4-diphosphocytidyl-2-C-methyl-D-erythritol kinase